MPTQLAIYQPREVDEALGLLERLGDGAKVLAGGTAMMIMLRQRLIAPEALVSIGLIPGLDSIEIVGDQVHIGALASHRSVELSSVVREHLPVLAQTFGKVANVRVRNVATVGGVLAEADYASDPPAVLVGLDADIQVRGLSGDRSIRATDFFRAFYETALEPGEIVTRVRIPLQPLGTGAVYEKFVTRSAEDRPCIGVFAACHAIAGGRFDNVRVVVGAASEIPQRFTDIEALGNGTDLQYDVCVRIAHAYADRIKPLDDIRGSSWYRLEMVKVWVQRALQNARTQAIGYVGSLSFDD